MTRDPVEAVLIVIMICLVVQALQNMKDAPAVGKDWLGDKL